MAQLPLRYTLRNLLRRKTRTALTLLGIALVVGAVVFMLAFSRSMAATFRQTGDPDNLIIISKKARTFVLSSIAANDVDQIRNKLYDDALTFDPVKGEPGKPIISPEVYIGLNVDVENAKTFREGAQRGLIHGLDPEIGMAANRNVKLVDGRLPNADRMELMVGRTAYTRIGVDDADLGVGNKIRMLGRLWKIVGRFEAKGTMMDCEIWAPINILQTYLKRWDYSFIRVKLKDVDRIAGLCKQLSTDEQFEVKAFAERAYFADYAEGFDYFRKFAQIMAIIIICGGLIAGMNTMYTAVLGRVREIGTLQVIGFSKRSVLVTILTESLLIAVAGGVLGCLIGVLANGIPMKIPMAAFTIKVDLVVIAWAMGAALFIGLAGAYVPAQRALRLRMVDAVRSQ